jgi:hypothetical protein
VEINCVPLPPKPKSWDEVYAITKNLHDVPIEEIEKGQAIWDYDFTSSDMRHCGRKGCKQVHGHGWIVDLKDGRFVHVGKDCAKNYANADLWQAQVAVYNERVRREAQNTAICNARDRAQTLFYWLDNNEQMRVAATLFSSFSSQARGPLLDDLRKRAEKDDVAVRKEVRLSIEEIERRREMATVIRPDGTTFIPQVPTSEFLSLGRLRGIGCFKYDIGDLARTVEKNASILLTSSHGEMTKQYLDELSRVASAMGNAKRHIERATNDVSLFLQSDNLVLLAKTDAALRQGIVSITVDGDRVVFTRKDHWQKFAA